MNATERQEMTQHLSAIRGLARKLREQSGVPAVETCARLSKMYAQVALWSLGAEDRFQFMDTVALGDEKR